MAKQLIDGGLGLWSVYDPDATKDRRGRWAGSRGSPGERDRGWSDGRSGSRTRLQWSDMGTASIRRQWDVDAAEASVLDVCQAVRKGRRWRQPHVGAKMRGPQFVGADPRRAHWERIWRTSRER
jgi:hypothetical protein